MANILSQMRMQQFDHAGSLVKDSQGHITLTSPLSVDLNAVQLRDPRRIQANQMQSSAIDIAFCRYQALVERLNDMDDEDAESEVLALEDFKGGLFAFIDPSLNHGPFVLSHGDLRPSKVIVDEHLNIMAIIDWEWSCAVPLQFFVPPTWLAGHDFPRLSDKKYHQEYAKFHQALQDVSSESIAARLLLLEEWTMELRSSPKLFLPTALLNPQNFTVVYFIILFRTFYKGARRQEQVCEFFEKDKATGIFSQAVQRKLEASKEYTKYMMGNK